MDLQKLHTLLKKPLEKQSSLPVNKSPDVSVNTKENGRLPNLNAMHKLPNHSKSLNQQACSSLKKRGRKRVSDGFKSQPISFNSYRSNIIKTIQSDFLSSRLDSKEIKLLDPHKSLKDFQQLSIILKHHKVGRFIAPSILIYVPDMFQFQYIKGIIEHFSLLSSVSVTSEKDDILYLGNFIVRKNRRTKTVRPRERLLIVMGNNNHQDLNNIQEFTQKRGIHLAYFVTPHIESIAHGYYTMPNLIDDFNKFNFFLAKLCGYIRNLCKSESVRQTILKQKKLRQLKLYAKKKLLKLNRQQMKTTKYAKTSTSQTKTII
jgi:hypothetical protein